MYNTCDLSFESIQCTLHCIALHTAQAHCACCVHCTNMHCAHTTFNFHFPTPFFMATTHLNVAKDNSLTIFDSIYSINSVNFLFHVHSSLFAFFSKFIFHLLSMILNEKNVKQKFLFIFLYF